jgi:hypothetical protein
LVFSCSWVGEQPRIRHAPMHGQRKDGPAIRITCCVVVGALTHRWRSMKTVKPETHKRRDHEQPPAIAQRGWRFHHVGIPTTTPRPNEVHLPHLKIHASGFDTSPYGIEWIRFDADCAVADLIRTVPHLAFEVDDLETALEGSTLLGEISSPSKGVRVAMIVDDGAPIELLEFSNSAK